MKLYTREQMIEAFNYGQNPKGFDWIGDMIDSLTAIQLPSDEEIHKQPTNQKINAWHIPDILKSCDKEIEELEKKYLATYGDKDNTAIGFKIGCEWMRDKILNQNK